MNVEFFQIEIATQIFYQYLLGFAWIRDEILKRDEANCELPFSQDQDENYGDK